MNDFTISGVCEVAKLQNLKFQINILYRLEKYNTLKSVALAVALGVYSGFKINSLLICVQIVLRI